MHESLVFNIIGVALWETNFVCCVILEKKKFPFLGLFAAWRLPYFRSSASFYLTFFRVLQYPRSVLYSFKFRYSCYIYALQSVWREFESRCERSKRRNACGIKKETWEWMYLKHSCMFNHDTFFFLFFSCIFCMKWVVEDRFIL